jgi:hypothetical protein
LVLADGNWYFADLLDEDIKKVYVVHLTLLHQMLIIACQRCKCDLVQMPSDIYMTVNEPPRSSGDYYYVAYFHVECILSIVH